jgi:hypothetical protein
MTGHNKAIFNAGFALPNVEITFPITPKICLRLDYNFSKKYEYVYSDFIDETNKRMICQAERFIMSPYRSKKIHKMVIKYSSYYGAPKIDKDIIKNKLSKKLDKAVAVGHP